VLLVLWCHCRCRGAIRLVDPPTAGPACRLRFQSTLPAKLLALREISTGRFLSRLDGGRQGCATALQVPGALAMVDANDVLVDDRPVVELLGDVVGRRPDQLDPALARAPIRIRAGERAGRSGGC
jgi:hypothetical protein